MYHVDEKIFLMFLPVAYPYFILSWVPALCFSVVFSSLQNELYLPYTENKNQN